MNNKNAFCKIEFIIIFFVLVTIFTSCSTGNQLQYFRDLPDSTTVHLPLMPPDQRIIQLGDRIQVSFGAKDEEAAAVFNRYGGVVTSGGNPTGSVGVGSQSNPELTGYLIDYDGYIEFPIIGKVKAEGLTTKELKDTLTKLVARYLRDPLVSVRFMTFKFTVLGEVGTPGVFNLPMQRTTILDALGQAGDLPHSAKRIIEVYRDYNGQRTITKIDLRKKELLYDTNTFIIKHNDILYVQPRESRLFSEEARFYTGLFTLVIGVVTLLISIIK
jgi:polysaccharide export outer membrane protein